MSWCREGPRHQSLRRARSTKQYRAQPTPPRDSHHVVVLRQRHGNSEELGTAAIDVIPRQALGVGLLAFAPLGGGILTDHYHRVRGRGAGSRFAARPNYKDQYRTDRSWSVVEALRAMRAFGRAPFVTRCARRCLAR
jgi:hypothetical protein